MLPENKQRNLNAQCQIIWYEWLFTDEDFISSKGQPAPEAASATNTDDLSAANGFDISNHLIDSCVFSKNLSSAAGSFSFRLDNSTNWKDSIKPGHWCIILMANDGTLLLPTNETPDAFAPAPKSIDTTKVRGICYIERVCSKIETLSNGAFNIYYEVSGRDYGVIYEDTDLFFNYFTYDQTIVNTLITQLQTGPTQSIDQLIRIAHDFFFNPQNLNFSPSQLSEISGLTSIQKQWLLPKPMVALLKAPLEGASFYGNLTGVLNFTETKLAIPIINILASIQGRAWDKLKEYSTPYLHELFCETTLGGHPQLIFRPIPWAIDTTGYSDLGIQTFQDLASSSGIDIDAIDLINSDLGEDEYNRRNYFLLDCQSNVIQQTSTISLLKDHKSAAGREFPFPDNPSIMRHGFKMNNYTIDSYTIVLDLLAPKNGEPSNSFLEKYNEVLVDYWQRAVFFESGAMQIIGRNDLKLGIVLRMGTDVPVNADRYYYVESYVDEFRIHDNGSTSWTQSVGVTRGVDKDTLATLTGFSGRQNPQNSVTDTFVKG